MRDRALARQLLNLALTVLFPIFDVFRLADVQRSAGVDECADGVVEPGGDELLFVLWRSTGFGRGDEAGAYPDACGAVSAEAK